jgi:hypothetical protein
MDDLKVNSPNGVLAQMEELMPTDFLDFYNLLTWMVQNPTLPFPICPVIVCPHPIVREFISRFINTTLGTHRYAIWCNLRGFITQHTNDDFVTILEDINVVEGRVLQLSSNTVNSDILIGRKSQFFVINKRYSLGAEKSTSVRHWRCAQMEYPDDYEWYLPCFHPLSETNMLFNYFKSRQLPEGYSPMQLKQTPIAAAIDEACAVETNPALLPHDEPELIVQAKEWQRVTHLLVGTILKKANLSSVKLTPSDLMEFAANNDCQFQESDDGSMVYRVTKKVK